MRTKRRAAPMPSKSDHIAPPTPNLTEPSLEKSVPCTQLATATVDPIISRKRGKPGDDSIRRSRRLAKSPPEMLDEDSDVQIIDLPEAIEAHTVEPEPLQPQTQDIELMPTPDPEGKEEEEEDIPSDAHSLKHQPDEGNRTTKKPSKPEISYHSLYLECRKKLDESAQTNNELVKKLAVAEGKLEVHEKHGATISSILDKLKDTMMVSAISKALEDVLTRGSCSAQPQPKGRGPAMKKTSVVSAID